ncbi:MAG TPA: ergothioneine biosynthesis protein EgtB [Steroidobacteraceae bacterium]
MDSQLAAAEEPHSRLRRQLTDVRSLTLALTAALSDGDATAQSMADASPAKWHLAHTTWFFESFLLAEFVPGYRLFDERFPVLFNSYYESKGTRILRGTRGLMTRPSLEEIRAYRLHVDQALQQALNHLRPAALELIELGCHHEQQHQELLLTDLLHLFAQNPLLPAAWPAATRLCDASPQPLRWIEGARGAVDMGEDGSAFAFDCERPRHTVWLSAHALADRLVGNAEWLAFLEDGGYRRAELWLSDGWTWVREQSVQAPLYWRRGEAGTFSHDFGLNGLRPLSPAAPVSHISYYEADAFARWAGARLPTEAEWESAASAADPCKGVFLDEPGAVGPLPAGTHGPVRQLFGDLWEWTGSAFLAYPGFRTAPGAVGEYNGKFMSGQFVLKGGSCATPRGHVRPSYRNFFYPHQRWQFTGVRLAKDL